MRIRFNFNQPYNIKISNCEDWAEVDPSHRKGALRWFTGYSESATSSVGVCINATNCLDSIGQYIHNLPSRGIRHQPLCLFKSTGLKRRHYRHFYKKLVSVKNSNSLHV